jgi:hypothetical protein
MLSLSQSLSPSQNQTNSLTNISTHQNWSYTQLVDFIKENPWKSFGLKDYVPSQIKNDREHNVVSGNIFGLKGMEQIHIRPAGLLSLLVWIKNPLFREAPIHLANSLKREFANEFQETLDSRVLGGSYMRKKKKIQEWIHTLMSERGVLDSANSTDFAKVVPDILDLQIIWIHRITNNNDEKDETHAFFSTNPGNWTSDKSTYIADLQGTWILEATEPNIQNNLYEWLQNQIIQSNWIVDYPTTDPNMTKSEIIERIRATIFGYTIDTSQKKDILAKKLAVCETAVGLGKVVYGS